MESKEARKVAAGAFVSVVAVVAALAVVAPAGATAARVKGKFIPAESGSPVLGSAHVAPQSDRTWRVGLTLQHVWRADYAVYVGSFVDANGDGVAQPDEQRAPVLVPECDLSHPTRKGHAGCVGTAAVEGTPDIVYLAVPAPPGASSFSAWAHLKR